MFGHTSSFPTTLAPLPTGQLLAAYASAPQRLRAALRGLTDQHLRATPVPGKWSILEIVLHLTDSELMGAARVRFALAQPGSALPGYDQDRWASAWRHGAASAVDLAASLELFEALRRMVGGAFHQLSDAEWEQSHGVHAEHGAVTMRNLLELYADHAERHLIQIDERRQLLGADSGAVQIGFEPRLY